MTSSPTAGWLMPDGHKRRRAAPRLQPDRRGGGDGRPRGAGDGDPRSREHDRRRYRGGDGARISDGRQPGDHPAAHPDFSMTVDRRSHTARSAITPRLWVARLLRGIGMSLAAYLRVM